MYSLTFFAWVGVVLFNVITGLIVDSFTALRHGSEERADILKEVSVEHRHLPPTTSHPPPSAHHLSPSAFHPPPSTLHPPPAFHLPPPATLPPCIAHLPGHRPLPITSHRYPSAIAD